MKLRIKENNQYHSGHYEITYGPKISESPAYDNYYCVRYGGHEYAVYDTEVQEVVCDSSVIKDYEAQISKVVHYDDAEYVWARIENGVIKFIKGSNVIDKVDCSIDYVDDFEYSFEYTENLILTALENLDNYNSGIEPRMVHN